MTAERLRLHYLPGGVFDIFEAPRREVRRSHPEYFRLDQAADVEDLIDVPQAERCDHVTTTRLALDEPFLRQAGQRRADRRLPYLVSIAYLLLG